MPASELAAALLATAKSDLKALKHMLDPEAFDDSVFGFHAQQAVEKALKAWLNLLRRSHPLTHDLSLLLHTLESEAIDIEPYWHFLELSGFAVRFRYEAFPEEEEPLPRQTLVSEIQALIDRVETLASPP